MKQWRMQQQVAHVLAADVLVVVGVSSSGGCHDSRCAEVSSEVRTGHFPRISASCVVGDLLLRDAEEGGLAGLSQVREIYGNLALEGNVDPLDLTPLSGVVMVDGNVSISKMTGFTGIPPTWELSYVGATLSFVEDHAIDGSLDLDSLEFVGEGLSATRNFGIGHIEVGGRPMTKVAFGWHEQLPLPR